MFLVPQVSPPRQESFAQSAAGATIASAADPKTAGSVAETKTAGSDAMHWKWMDELINEYKIYKVTKYPNIHMPTGSDTFTEFRYKIKQEIILLESFVRTYFKHLIVFKKKKRIKCLSQIEVGKTYMNHIRTYEPKPHPR